MLELSKMDVGMFSMLVPRVYFIKRKVSVPDVKRVQEIGYFQLWFRR